MSTCNTVCMTFYVVRVPPLCFFRKNEKINHDHHHIFKKKTKKSLRARAWAGVMGTSREHDDDTDMVLLDYLHCSLLLRIAVPVTVPLDFAPCHTLLFS